MEYRNPVFNAFGTIDCEVNHPKLGWIPFTASPDDVVEVSRDIFAEAQSSAAAYVAPSAEDARLSMFPLTARQIRLGLLSAGITEPQVDAALSGDPAGMIEWKYASEFKRLHPLVVSLGAAFSLTPAQIDQLWTAALTL